MFHEQGPGKGQRYISISFPELSSQRVVPLRPFSFFRSCYYSSAETNSFEIQFHFIYVSFSSSLIHKRRIPSSLSPACHPITEEGQTNFFGDRYRRTCG